MTREELIKWLDDEIIHSAELCEDGDAKSWGYEEGILISRNEAEEIREFLSLPPAEGAQQKYAMQGWICPRCGKVHGPFTTVCSCPPETKTAATITPTAEGAEEILEKYEIGYDEQYHRMVYERDALKAMHEFATLHARKMAEKNMEEFIKNLSPGKIQTISFMIADGNYQTAIKIQKELTNLKSKEQ